MLWKAWSPLSVTKDATAACRRQRGAGHARLAAEAPALDRAERSLARPVPEDAERSFCLTSAQAASRAESARSPPSVTAGTARRTGCRSCTGSSAPRTAARSPWRPSPATRPIAGGERRGLGAREGQGDTKRIPRRAAGPRLPHAARRPLGQVTGPTAPAGHGTILLSVVAAPTGFRNGQSSPTA